MQGWTLSDVRDLDEDEYDVIVTWLNKQDNKDDDSVDIDEVIEARRLERERQTTHDA